MSAQKRPGKETRRARIKREFHAMIWPMLTEHGFKQPTKSWNLVWYGLGKQYIWIRHRREFQDVILLTWVPRENELRFEGITDAQSRFPLYLGEENKCFEITVHELNTNEFSRFNLVNGGGVDGLMTKSKVKRRVKRMLLEFDEFCETGKLSPRFDQIRLLIRKTPGVVHDRRFSKPIVRWRGHIQYAGKDPDPPAECEYTYARIETDPFRLLARGFFEAAAVQVWKSVVGRFRP